MSFWLENCIPDYQDIGILTSILHLTQMIGHRIIDDPHFLTLDLKTIHVFFSSPWNRSLNAQTKISQTLFCCPTTVTEYQKQAIRMLQAWISQHAVARQFHVKIPILVLTTTVQADGIRKWLPMTRSLRLVATTRKVYDCNVNL